MLLDALGLPYIPLPSSHLMQENKGWASWTEHERFTLSLNIARAVLAAVDPQLVVFDCFPNSAFLAAALERQVPIALCLREMRDLNKYLKEVSELLPKVSLILIPHAEGAFDLPAGLRERSHFVGPVMKPVPAGRIERRKDSLRAVITGGGGGYPGTFRFYNQALRAVSELRQQYPRLEALAVIGPLFRDWSLLQPMTGIRIIPFDPDLFSTFASADLVISVAGYNTVTELQYIGTRTILVPAERLWDDQFARAEYTMQKYSNFSVFRGSSHVDLESLASALLTRTVTVSALPVPDGATKAALCLRSALA